MLISDRFWQKVDKTDTCWNWKGCKTQGGGYGQFAMSHGKRIPAHRFAYEQLVGIIPIGLQIDHLCRNRACVNPYHMEPVTPRINTRRGGNARKTHCIRGHELSDSNNRPYAERKGWRACRTCANARQNMARALKRVLMSA